MLVLAHVERYQEWISRASLQPIDASAFQAASEMDGVSFKAIGDDAVIEVTGPLSYKMDFWSWMMGGASYTSIRKQVRAAENDEDIQRIVMIFDTPGGEVTGIVELAKVLRDCKKEIVAFVDPLCASAGLWLASQCDSILSTESGEIGSLGVQAIAFSQAEYLKKTGLDVKVIRAAISPDKNLGHPYEDLGEKAVEYLQERVDKKGVQFVEAVASGRGVTEKKVKEQFGKGRMLDADEALAVGLIDGISSLEDALYKKKPTGKRKRRASLRSRIH